MVAEMEQESGEDSRVTLEIPFSSGSPTRTSRSEASSSLWSSLATASTGPAHTAALLLPLLELLSSHLLSVNSSVSQLLTLWTVHQDPPPLPMSNPELPLTMFLTSPLG